MTSKPKHTNPKDAVATYRDRVIRAFNIQTTDLTKDETENLAQQFPVLVHVTHDVTNRGQFHCNITVYTRIFYRGDGVMYYRSRITNNLVIIQRHDSSDNISADFDTAADAEAWVKTKIDGIRARRAEIIANQKQELPAGDVLLV